MIYANNEHIFLCYSVIIATIYPDFTIPFRYPCLTTVLFSRSLESCHRSYVNSTPKCHEHFRGPRRRSLSKIINLLHARNNTASGEGLLFKRQLLTIEDNSRIVFFAGWKNAPNALTTHKKSDLV
jgi:hypothetical protein